MLAPRWSDAAYWRAVWDDLRPRFVLVRVDVGGRSLRWGVPLWPFEETLRFALLVLPWLAYAWRRAPASWRARAAVPLRRGWLVAGAAGPAPWRALAALLDGQGEGMLRLPAGSPFVQLEAADGEDAVRIEILQA
jgi:hypothetical protein